MGFYRPIWKPGSVFDPGNIQINLSWMILLVTSTSESSSSSVFFFEICCGSSSEWWVFDIVKEQKLYKNCIN